MKRRTFFKACAGALAGVAGCAGYKVVKPEERVGFDIPHPGPTVHIEQWGNAKLPFDIRVSQKNWVKQGESFDFSTNGIWQGRAILQRMEIDGPFSGYWQDIEGAAVGSRFDMNVSFSATETRGAWFRVKTECLDGEWKGELFTYFNTSNPLFLSASFLRNA